MEMTNAQISHLTRLLNTELQCANGLISLLEREHQALTGSDPEQIIAISEEKQTRLGQMQQHLADRQGFLGSLGLKGDRETVEALLHQQTNADTLQQTWQQLMTTATRLSNNNQVNGGIITLGHRHIKEALGILTGHNSSNDTYGPEGRQGDPTSRSLAKA